MSYDKAFNAWSTFHQKVSPNKVFEVDHPWPQDWGYAGLVVVTFYTSDKWNADDDYVDYYHDHGKRIGCWYPRGSNTWLSNKACPVKSFPSDAAVLGYSGGWIIKQVGTNEPLQAQPGRNSLLCCFPDMKTLFCLDSKNKVVALFHGPGLHIEDRGIVG